MPEEKPENLVIIYEEICRAHNSIADFRVKLLALLPIASGAGVFLLVSNQPENAELSHLLPIGVFESSLPWACSFTNCAASRSVTA